MSISINDLSRLHTLARQESDIAENLSQEIEAVQIMLREMESRASQHRMTSAHIVDVMFSLETGDGSPTGDELISQGWAPGGYLHLRCRECGEEFEGEKLARCCKLCALTAANERRKHLKALLGEIE